MRTIISASIVGILAILLSSCFPSVSKRLIQEIEFSNLSGGTVQIMNQMPLDVVTLQDDDVNIVDISSTNLIKISFSDSNTFFKYDLSDLDIKVAPDKKKTGKSIWGKIRWFYTCTINKDKSLTFKQYNQKKELIEIRFNPIETTGKKSR